MISEGKKEREREKEREVERSRFHILVCKQGNRTDHTCTGLEVA
jgi:hypothetical protein